MKPIVINTGLVDIPLVNEKGDSLGIISFNPKDYNLAVRIKDGMEKIKEICSIEYDNMNNEESLDLYKKCESDLREEINKIFDYDVSSVLFQNMSSLSSSKGKLFIEQFLEGVSPVIIDEIQKEQKASEKRISKYTNHYENK
jgi:hypothetical protein